jgi:hypothetical protein
MARTPLTIEAGKIERLPAGAGLDVGGWNLPSSGGTQNYVLVADASGHAVWSSSLSLLALDVDNITINGATITSDTGAISFDDENLSTSGTMVGSNIPSPTVDDQVLISTASGVADWQTAGNNQVLTSSSSGEVTWTNQPSGMSEPTADDQLLVATGVGSASWTDTLDILKVDSITIDGSTITSSDTTIGFGSENLSTTGDLTVGRVTAWRDNSGGGDSAGIFTRNQSGGGVPNDVIRVIFEDDGALVDGTGPSIQFENKEVATAANVIAEIAARRREGDDTSGSLDFYTYSAGVATNGGRFNPDGSFTLLVGLTVTGGPITGSNIPSPTVDDQVLISTAADTAAWSTAGNNQVLASNGSGEVAWLDQSSLVLTESDTLDTVADRGATTDQTLTTGGITTTGTVSAGLLTVDNITINGAVITSDTGAISFSNENLTTTGTVVGSNIPSPTVDDQVLISTTSGIAGWQTAGNNQYLASDGSGGVAWANKTFGTNIPANSAVNEIYVGTGAGTAAWTTDLAGLTSLTVDNITINGAVISSDTGAISFSNENITTTGSMTANSFTDGTSSLTGGSLTGVKLGSLTTNGFVKTSGGDGTLSVDTSTYLTAETDTLDTVADRGATTDQILTTGGITTTGTITAGLLTVDNITINGAVISSDTGAISFSNENLTTTGTLTSGQLDVSHNGFPAANITRTTTATTGAGSIFRIVYASSGDITDGFGPGFLFAISDTGVSESALAGIYAVRAGADNTGDLIFRLSTAGGLSEKMRLTSGGVLSGMTSLTVDNITINADDITSDTGTISFDDENLSTTGTMVASNIPSPSASGKALVSTAADTAAWFTTSLFDVLKIEVPSASGAERKFVLTADPGSQFEIEAAPWPLTLTANETIYIRTTGNDTTGDGSVTFPFLTLEKTIEYIGQLYIGDYTVTVDIGEGVFTEAGTLSFQHPYGSQVTWQGVSEQITSQDTNSISASGTSLGFSNLYYYDVTFILPVGKSVSVGDYIAVRAVSGGTLPNALRGCHYVSTWVGGSRTATVRVVYRNVAPKASGTITCTIELIKTVIAFSNKNGLKLNGTYTGGSWRGLVLQGDYNDTNTSAKYGIWLLNSATLNFGGLDTSGNAVGIVGFQTGMYAQNNAMMFADYCFVSRCGTRCANAQNGGILNLRYAHLSGANNEGIFCFNGSTCAGQEVAVVGCGDNSIYSYQGSFIDARTAYVDENNATNAFFADRWSSIDANSSTYSDSISPSTPGNNDGSYVIIA